MHIWIAGEHRLKREEKMGRWVGRKADDEGSHRRPSINGRPAVGDGDVY
jgi:hypothetical protein